MRHPLACYSHDLNNNCTIIKWGEPGYYKTDYPEGNYTDEVVDKINEEGGITHNERRAMEICSMAAQNNPDLNWEKHFAFLMEGTK